MIPSENIVSSTVKNKNGYGRSMTTKWAMFCQTCCKHLSLVDKPRLPFIWWYIKFPRWSIEESSVFVGERSLWNASTARIERKGNNWFERYTYSKSTPKSGWTSEEKTVLPVYTAYVIAKKKKLIFWLWVHLWASPFYEGQIKNVFFVLSAASIIHNDIKSVVARQEPFC